MLLSEIKRSELFYSVTYSQAIVASGLSRPLFWKAFQNFPLLSNSLDASKSKSVLGLGIERPAEALASLISAISI